MLTAAFALEHLTGFHVLGLTAAALSTDWIVINLGSAELAKSRHGIWLSHTPAHLPISTDWSRLAGSTSPKQ